METLERKYKSICIGFASQEEYQEMVEDKNRSEKCSQNNAEKF